MSRFFHLLVRQKEERGPVEQFYHKYCVQLLAVVRFLELYYHSICSYENDDGVNQLLVTKLLTYSFWASREVLLGERDIQLNCII